MKNFGLMRVASCSPQVKPADVTYNTARIREQLDQCVELNADLAVFPELSLTGYTCADLFTQDLLLECAMQSMFDIARDYKEKPITIVAGLPVSYRGRLYNCAAVISEGKIKGIVPKTYIPNYAEFYEKRWFASGRGLHEEIRLEDKKSRESTKIPFGTDLLFDINGVLTGVEICEDLWVPIPPSSYMAINGASIILNLSATNELIGKYKYLCDLIANQSARCRCVYVYASAGTGESSTDLAFSGNCIIAENGRILTRSPRFMLEGKISIADVDIEKIVNDRNRYDTSSNSDPNYSRRIIEINTQNTYSNEPIGNFMAIDPLPFIDEDQTKMEKRVEEILSIQSWGLAMRLRAINCKKAVIGISGGLDSTLALLVTVKAFDMLGLNREGIIAVSMPGFGTTDRTRSNADKLMKLLGVTNRVIPISESVLKHFEDIGHNAQNKDVTYENSQARIRTLILMDLANKEGGIVIGTGDLSELALGWCTYNGDQMSMYGVNASIPKTLVKYLVNGYAQKSDDTELKKVLKDITETPISPELLPPDSNDNINQKTEDLVGPYELHDFFLYQILRYGLQPAKVKMMALKAFEGIYDQATIEHWLTVFYRRFFNQQFKRSVMPDGIKAGTVSLSPRGDWRMPSDASSSIFIEDIKN